MVEDKDSFAIIVRGQRFTLIRGQIESEPESLFAKTLLGDFKEGETRELKLDRHPAVFSLIIDHLSGYRILPIAEATASRLGMDREELLRYVEDDAEYYGLGRLNDFLKAKTLTLTSQAASAGQKPTMSDLQLRIAVDVIEKGLVQCERRNYGQRREFIRGLQTLLQTPSGVFDGHAYY